jgi:hypothetical protein
MGQRATLTTQDYLVKAELPEATETYTVISHKSIIDRTKATLEKRGFEIVRELYRCNQGAKIAQGVYHLKYGEDPDMSMMFAWSNSYDKSMRFKCSIGGYVHSSLSSIVSHKTSSSWDRKHTGTADDEVFETIDNQITHAEDYFKALVEDKELMKKIPVSDQTRAELMGRLYFVHELLTSEQLSTVRNQFNKPSFTCNGIENSVWQMYNAIILSLQQAHPKSWMDQQKLIHWFLCDHFDIAGGALAFLQPEVVTQAPVVDPNQLNIVDEIAKAEIEKPVIEMLREEADSELAHAMGTPDTTGKEFFEMADETIIVERTEAELNHELHGVDNVNVEATLSQPVVVDTPVAEEDTSWECLGCGTMQGIEDAFHDGQLCTTCHTNKVENGEFI